ncbi:MAG: GAP family protein [Candidatus Nanopelagicales bacterium]
MARSGLDSRREFPDRRNPAVGTGDRVVAVPDHSGDPLAVHRASSFEQHRVFDRLVLGDFGWGAAFVLLASIIELADEPPTWASWTRSVLGLALIALGIKKWFGRSPDDASPAWMRSIDQLQPAGALRLSLVLSLANPKVLLLAAAAGIAIGSFDVGTGTTVVSIVVCAAISASTVAVPVVLYLVRGPAILVPLGKVRAWLERHNAAVHAIVMVAIGVALSLQGIDGI